MEERLRVVLCWALMLKVGVLCEDVRYLQRLWTLVSVFKGLEGIEIYGKRLVGS